MHKPSYFKRMHGVGAIPCGCPHKTVAPVEKGNRKGFYICPPKTVAPEQKGNRKGLPLHAANV